MACLCGGTGSEPVVRASRSTAVTCAAEGRFSTHSPVRRMLAGVCERAPKPSMQLRPSHHADDMGARLGVPSGLTELTRTTGVPKYRIAGSRTEGTGTGPGSRGAPPAEAPVVARPKLAVRRCPFDPDVAAPAPF